MSHYILKKLQTELKLKLTAGLDEFALFEVTVSKDSVTDGHFKMIFSYTPTDGGNRKVCTFRIPVKQ